MKQTVALERVPKYIKTRFLVSDSGSNLDKSYVLFSELSSFIIL